MVHMPAIDQNYDIRAKFFFFPAGAGYLAGKNLFA
jgi:hypothetical protein